MLPSSTVTDVEHTSVERLDELIHRTWDAGGDRKMVLRSGISAARLLLSETSDLVTLFWPVPRPLEFLDRWLGTTRPAGGAMAAGRPIGSALVPGCALGAVVTHLVVRPHVGDDHELTVMPWIILASIAVLAGVFKLLIEATFRRRLARLDDETALAILLAQVQRGVRMAPRLVPEACEWFRNGLARAKG